MILLYLFKKFCPRGHPEIPPPGWTSVDFLLTPTPPLLVHVVVECPLMIHETSVVKKFIFRAPLWSMLKRNDFSRKFKFSRVIKLDNPEWHRWSFPIYDPNVKFKNYLPYTDKDNIWCFSFLVHHALIKFTFTLTMHF